MKVNTHLKRGTHHEKYRKLPGTRYIAAASHSIYVYLLIRRRSRVFYRRKEDVCGARGQLNYY